MEPAGEPPARGSGLPRRFLASWPGRGVAALVVLGLLVIVVRLGFRWEEQRHPPLPPQAVQVGEQLFPGAYRQTTLRVPSSVADVRRFYHDTLPTQGWRYCGTQATPGCTKMPRMPEAAAEIDVYRRVDDRDGTGVTIEMWPRWVAAQGHTFVTVYETSFQTASPP